MAHSNNLPQFRPQRATTSRDLGSTRVLHHIEMGLTTGQGLYTVMHLEVYSWRSPNFNSYFYQVFMFPHISLSPYSRSSSTSLSISLS